MFFLCGQILCASYLNQKPIRIPKLNFIFICFILRLRVDKSDQNRLIPKLDKTSIFKISDWLNDIRVIRIFSIVCVDHILLTFFKYESSESDGSHVSLVVIRLFNVLTKQRKTSIFSNKEKYINSKLIPECNIYINFIYVLCNNMKLNH